MEFGSLVFILTIILSIYSTFLLTHKTYVSNLFDISLKPRMEKLKFSRINKILLYVSCIITPFNVIIQAITWLIISLEYDKIKVDSFLFK